MRAIHVAKTGGPEALTLVDIPVPTPKPDEAVVQIKASGINFIDVYIREGRYTAPTPITLGQEAAGIVSAVGSAVKDMSVGDRVAYTGVLGSYAEYAAVPAERLVKIPADLDFRHAAASMLQGMTAHYLTHSTFPLKHGDVALIHAAAGGMGLLLVQMAKMLGARAIGTAGSEEKARLAREAGADDIILYRECDFVEEVKRITAGRGVDVIYDGVGKDTFVKGLDAVRRRGMAVLYGGASGPVPPIDLVTLSQKGSLFVTRPTLAHYTAERAELLERASAVLGWVARGKLSLRIEHTYPLEEAARAHRDLEGRKTTGKLLLLP